MNEITREYLKALGPQTGGKVGDAMARFAGNPKDKAAAEPALRWVTESRIESVVLRALAAGLPDCGPALVVAA